MYGHDIAFTICVIEYLVVKPLYVDGVYIP